MKADFESHGWRRGERRQRRIVLMSIGIAAVAHLIFFLVAPPRILLLDGSRAEEPPDRFLEASNMALRVLEVSPVCADRFQPGLPPFEGEVRLQVGREGRVSVMGLEVRSGNRCADAVLLSAAESLWYRWLPDERYPAPVDLVQPLRVSAAASS